MTGYEFVQFHKNDEKQLKRIVIQSFWYLDDVDEELAELGYSPDVLDEDVRMACLQRAVELESDAEEVRECVRELLKQELDRQGLLKDETEDER